MTSVYIKRIALYAPGLESKEDWALWTKGEKELLKEVPSPKIAFVPMLTRRRLSALSKMVVLVNHEVSYDDQQIALAPVKVTFASEFGEIAQQLKISQIFLEQGTVSPAHFSLSVFNASIANATILEKNEAGYSAVFSGKKAFSAGLADCVSSLRLGSDSERIFIFADELIPETYAPIAGVSYPNAPCALALRLSTSADGAIALLDDSAFVCNAETASDEALAYIKERLLPVL